MIEINIGDWVTINGKPYQFRRFTKYLPEWNKSLDYENVEMLCGVRFHIPNFDRSIVKPWQPKEGEWCLFLFDSSKKKKQYELGQFLEEVYDTDGKYYTSKQNTKKWFDYCEPFIGKIPAELLK